MMSRNLDVKFAQSILNGGLGRRGSEGRYASRTPAHISSGQLSVDQREHHTDSLMIYMPGPGSRHLEASVSLGECNMLLIVDGVLIYDGPFSAGALTGYSTIAWSTRAQGVECVSKLAREITLHNPRATIRALPA